MVQAPYVKGQSTIHMISIGVNPVPPPKYGGIETVVANLSDGLARAGHEVKIYSPGACPITTIHHVQTMDEAVQNYVNDQLVINPAEHTEAIKKGLAEHYEAGDIIHLHHQLLADELGDLVGTNANICETAHWKATGLNTNICYPSKAIRDFINKPGEIVFHGIDLNLWQPDQSATIVKDSLLYVGRLTEDKGVDIALLACERRGLKLMVAGPMPGEKNKFGLNIINKVDYLGEKTPAELQELYSSARGMIYMTQYCEPFGLAVVEAMACGCPVITSGMGATSETVIDGETGFVVANVSELCLKIEQLDTLKKQDCIEQAHNFDLLNQVAQQESAYSLFFM